MEGWWLPLINEAIYADNTPGLWICHGYVLFIQNTYF